MFSCSRLVLQELMKVPSAMTAAARTSGVESVSNVSSLYGAFLFFLEPILGRGEAGYLNSAFQYQLQYHDLAPGTEHGSGGSLVTERPRHEAQLGHLAQRGQGLTSEPIRGQALDIRHLSTTLQILQYKYYKYYKYYEAYQRTSKHYALIS